LEHLEEKKYLCIQPPRWRPRYGHQSLHWRRPPLGVSMHHSLLFVLSH
jgi:hypothetical protein